MSECSGCRKIVQRVDAFGFCCEKQCVAWSKFERVCEWLMTIEDPVADEWIRTCNPWEPLCLTTRLYVARSGEMFVLQNDNERQYLFQEWMLP